TKGIAEVGLHLAEEAGAELPIGGEPHAVAAVAVVVAHGGDHAHRARRAGEGEVARGAVPSRALDRRQRPDGGDPLEYLVRGHEGIARDLEVVPGRHYLDEPDVPRAL